MTFFLTVIAAITGIMCAFLHVKLSLCLRICGCFWVTSIQLYLARSFLMGQRGLDSHGVLKKIEVTIKTLVDTVTYSVKKMNLFDFRVPHSEFQI